MWEVEYVGELMVLVPTDQAGLPCSVVPGRFKISCFGPWNANHLLLGPSPNQQLRDCCVSTRQRTCEVRIDRLLSASANVLAALSLRVL